MKIVFPRMETLPFHNAYDGGSKFIHYLAENLVKRGIEVEIVTTNPKNASMKSIEKNGVKYTFLPPLYTGRKRALNLPYKFLFSYHLNNYLKKIDFDILHSTEMFSYFYLHNKQRKKVIFQCWALEAWPQENLKPKGVKNGYNRFLLRPPWKYCILNSDSIASDGEHQLKRLEKIGIPSKKIWFIPNGVTFKKIQNLKKEHKSRRIENNIKKEDLVVLSVCQIAPDKGIEDIIKGFALVKKEIKNSKLIMIGRGSLEEDMHELIKKNNLGQDVIHLKNLSEDILFDYFFSSDIFVSAVNSEDFMISIEEGMACGLPIVSSAQPFLVKNKKNGYVVGINNPEGIAEGIIKIYKSGRKKMKQMGKESKKMAEQYDYENIATLAIKEYKKLVKIR